MRKILIFVGILMVLTIGATAVWIFQGDRISAYLDRYGTVAVSSEKISSIRYEGSGSGGVLYANQLVLSLDTVAPSVRPPSIGSTKDGKLGLAVGGKVFPLGPLTPSSNESSESLTAAPDKGDDATVRGERSRWGWPTPFQLNFMTGISPSWKRHTYQQLIWIKPNGSRLEMVWHYEQFYYRGSGWASPTMTVAGKTGLIRIDITNPEQ
jgi:hypothetical protein